ncbi:MAG: hypothetical protein EB003_12095 [Flavobacteriia bacterium]|nr:hypothetical protein [Flavobacteriia bacterium]
MTGPNSIQIEGEQILAVAAFDLLGRKCPLTKDGVDLEKQLTETQMTQLSSVFELCGDKAAENWRKVMRKLSSSI